MERREDRHGGGEVESVCGRFGEGADNTVRPIVPHHELGNTVVTALHVCAATVEGRQENEVVNRVSGVVRAVLVCSSHLCQLRCHKVVLGL